MFRTERDVYGLARSIFRALEEVDPYGLAKLFSKILPRDKSDKSGKDAGQIVRELNQELSGYGAYVEIIDDQKHKLRSKGRKK